MAITLALGFLTLQVYAAGDDEHAKHGQAVNHAGKAQGVAQDMTDGEIRKVDKDGKRSPSSTEKSAISTCPP